MITFIFSSFIIFIVLSKTIFDKAVPCGSDVSRQHASTVNAHKLNIHSTKWEINWQMCRVIKMSGDDVKHT